VDHRDGLLDPPLLKPQRDPDVVVAGLHDDQRGRERAKVKARDLGGDRAYAAGAGSYVPRPRDAVYDGIPAQEAGQDDGPRLDWITWPDPGGERGADNGQGGHAGFVAAPGAFELLLAAGQGVADGGLAEMP
jgi:hypothetical protein